MRCLLTVIALLALAAPAWGQVVVLDPGHGGSKEGAVSADGVREKDVALKLARALKTELEKSSVKVLLTREGDFDLGLAERMKIANDAGADLFVSIHLNSFPPKARKRVHGVETYFLSTEATEEQARRVAEAENAEAGPQQGPTDDLAFILSDLARTEAHRDSSKLAYLVHQHMVADLGANDRGVHQAPFIVLMGAQMPAILAEVGFLSHPDESKLLVDHAHQKKIVRSLAAGIVSFLKQVGGRDHARQAAGMGGAGATPAEATGALTDSPSPR
jgi:N-acetylmuramoyl-L-alanine amidase